ncbi:MAG TPA: histidine kinase [Solirubrobacteraceae bacterium]|nr:histidine kinase [Solirubrobacteraceae bacterium]
MQGAPTASLPPDLLVRRWPEGRRVVLASAAVLLAAVLVALLAADDGTLGLPFLAVVPVVLVALELGRGGGLAAALLASAGVTAASLAGRPEVDAAGLATCSGVLIATGAIAGWFSDRMRAMQAREERLLRAGLRLGEAGARDRVAELAAREAMAMPGTLGAAVRLDGVPEVRLGGSGGVRTSVAMSAHGVRVGTLEVVHATAPSPEDRGALEVLAGQAAVVSESLRLLDLDGERAALESRLRDVRRELLDSRSGTGLLLQAQEADRRRMAEKLHEDLAQILSAVLLGLRMAGRSENGGAHPSLVELHEQVAGVLAEVRDVARELRPVVLDQLGLVAGLEVLASAAKERGARVTLRAEPVLPDTPDDVETAIYRLVEDAFAVEPGGSADVDLHGVEGGLEVTIAVGTTSPETLLTLRTRVESAGGTITTSDSPTGGTVLRATMPTRAR